MKTLALILSLILLCGSDTSGQRKKRNLQKRLPVIDMHLHAEPLSEFGGGQLSVCPGDQDFVFPGLDPRRPISIEKMVNCKKPIVSSSTDEKLMAETFAEFKKFNIRRAVTSGPLDLVTKWRAASPETIIPAQSFADRDPSASEFRRLFTEDKFQVFAEVGVQYRGLSPSDPTLESYFALAEELDIPIGIHLGEGPPGGVHLIGPPAYRVKMGSPLLLEDVIVRHPKIRIYAMHYGSPLVDEMIAMLFSHPQLYVDISCNNWAMPRKQFYEHLRKMVEAGFGERIMFGSDQMAWPKSIGIAVDSIEKAPFLTYKQKRDILYNNAARFLRLSPEDIARDHK